MRVRWRNTGTIAMALLVLGCVLAALAGPAQSARTRTQALQQTFGRLSSLVKTVQVTGQLSTFDAAIRTSGGSGATADSLSAARADLRSDLAGVPLPLGKGDWAGLTAPLKTLVSAVPRPAVTGAPPQLAPVYRDTLAGNVTVVSGSLQPPARPGAGVLPVCVTEATAARFALRPGSTLLIKPGVGLLVTGIVRARGPGSTFWTDDPLALAPQLQVDRFGRTWWTAAVLTDPGQFGRLVGLFPLSDFEMQWDFPVDPSGITADQVDTFRQRLSSAVSTQPALSPGLEPTASTLELRTSLLDPVATFAAAQQAALAVLLLMFVSLIMVGAAVITLAARMIVARRDEELIMFRARGAANWQVAALMLRTAALAAIPAAAAGVLLSRLAAGGGPMVWLGWPLAAFVAVVALAGPPVIALWRHRRPAPPANRARVISADPRITRFSARALRRLVAEVAACAAAIGGLAVLHGQGVPADGGINWYLTVAPILVAIPAVVLTLRIYPLVIRVLLRLAARRASAGGYVALAGSARTSLAAVGPAFALVLALALATFAGMVSDAVNSGQDAQSWQQAGADVIIDRGLSVAQITPAAQRAVAGVRGVELAAASWHSAWLGPDAQPVQVAAVDPASYPAFVARTPFPPISAADLGVTGGTYRVVVNAAAAQILGGGPQNLTPIEAAGPVRVQVGKVVSSTPTVLDTGTAWIVIRMPANIHEIASTARPAPDQILLIGVGIDRAELDKLVHRVLPGMTVKYRSDMRAALHASPLSLGAQQLMLLTVLAAAGLGLVNLVLGLALGAADRELTLARLTVMGFAKQDRLVITETLPAIIAALLAGLGCALALPALVGSALDLSVFTGGTVTVRLVPGFTALGAPSAGLLLLSLVILIAQTRIARHRGATSLLRAT